MAKHPTTRFTLSFKDNIMNQHLDQSEELLSIYKKYQSFLPSGGIIPLQKQPKRKTPKIFSNKEEVP